MSGDGRPPKSPPRDLLFVGTTNENGDMRVLRQRQDQLEVGLIRPVVEGQALHGEVVRLAQRSEHARLFDVEVLYDGRRAGTERDERSGGAQLRATTDGPPQISSAAYRTNWQRVFGGTDERDEAPVVARAARGKSDLN
ncbi:MAG: hypothetical protein EXR75_15680 [Myxococcales bacterium]|nr:hypothetical protein [Myxococcales bacterium]